MKKLLFILLLVTSLFAQNGVAPLPQSKPQFFTRTGSVCSGCKLYSFVTGTGVPLQTYTDSSGTVQNQNPITMGSDGRPPQEIWLGAFAYDLTLKDSFGSVIYSVKNISVPNIQALTQASLTVAGPVIIAPSNSGIVNSSSVLEWDATYSNGTSIATDKFQCSNIPAVGANPATVLTCNHSGSSGGGSVLFNFPFVSLSSSSFLKFTESLPPACLVGLDFLWGDSTTHRVKECDNNGVAVQLVHAGADVNNSDQVTVTHLASALPVLQGGTGVTTAQGNGTKVQLSSGATVSGDFVSYDANGNSVDSAKAVPSGVVVGTTDTQVLSGKTLNSPTITNPSATGLTTNHIFVASDFTTANNTSLQIITGLSWTFPATASSYSFHCSLLYSQATAAVADAFGIQAATNAPTNIAAKGRVDTSATAVSSGPLATLSTTTATNIVTFTPSATVTTFGADLDGTLELPASANTVNIMVSTSAGADAVTVKRGSYCQLF